MPRRTRPPHDQGQPELIVLPAAAAALSADVQELARQFIATRRRLGTELLEAARLIAEARERTAHGQWYLFLEVTGTGQDTADRLADIHARVAELPAFEEAIRRGRLSESVAWRLAQPSVPAEAVVEVLSEHQPLTVRFVVQHLRRLRRPRQAASGAADQAGSTPSAQEEQIPPRVGIWNPTPQAPWPPGRGSEPPQTIVVLSDVDWAAARRLTGLLAGCAAGEELLSSKDWLVLGPLAETLSKIKRRQRRP